MSKYELKFLDHFEDGAFIKCESVRVGDLNQAEKNVNYEKMILISSNSFEGNTNTYLDRSTALKFIEEMIVKLNKIDEEMFTELVKKEVNNG